MLIVLALPLRALGQTTSPAVFHYEAQAGTSRATLTLTFEVDDAGYPLRDGTSELLTIYEGQHIVYGPTDIGKGQIFTRSIHDLDTVHKQNVLSFVRLGQQQSPQLLVNVAYKNRIARNLSFDTSEYTSYGALFVRDQGGKYSAHALPESHDGQPGLIAIAPTEDDGIQGLIMDANTTNPVWEVYRLDMESKFVNVSSQSPRFLQQQVELSNGALARLRSTPTLSSRDKWLDNLKTDITRGLYADFRLRPDAHAGKTIEALFPDASSEDVARFSLPVLQFNLDQFRQAGSATSELTALYAELAVAALRAHRAPGNDSLYSELQAGTDHTPEQNAQILAIGAIRVLADEIAQEDGGFKHERSNGTLASRETSKSVRDLYPRIVAAQNNATAQPKTYRWLAFAYQAISRIYAHGGYLSTALQLEAQAVYDLDRAPDAQPPDVLDNDGDLSSLCEAMGNTTCRDDIDSSALSFVNRYPSSRPIVFAIRATAAERLYRDGATEATVTLLSSLIDSITARNENMSNEWFLALQEVQRPILRAIGDIASIRGKTELSTADSRKLSDHLSTLCQSEYTYTISRDQGSLIMASLSDMVKRNGGDSEDLYLWNGCNRAIDGAHLALAAYAWLLHPMAESMDNGWLERQDRTAMSDRIAALSAFGANDKHIDEAYLSAIEEQLRTSFPAEDPLQLQFSAVRANEAWRSSDIDEAQEIWDRAGIAQASSLRLIFPTLTESERLRYVAAFNDMLSNYAAFALASKRPWIARRLLSLTMVFRGAVAQSVGLINSSMSTAPDITLERLRTLRSRIAVLQLQATASTADRNELNGLVAQADGLEKARGANVRLGSTAFSTLITSDDIAERLKPDEAAVEYLRFQDHDGRAFLGTYRYVALILRGGDAQPTLVDLGSAEPIEAAYRQYRAYVESPYVSNSSGAQALAALVWQPVEPLLQRAHVVDLWTDGVLNAVSFAVLPGQSQKPLLQQFRLRYVNSFRDIIDRSGARRTSRALLFADPAYALGMSKSVSSPGSPSTDATDIVRSIYKKPTMSLRELIGAQPISPLPNTQLEVGAIAKLLPARGIQPELFEQSRATKANLTFARQPRILHIATHGFFLNDASPEETVTDTVLSAVSRLRDPMLRSGLIFAGADRFLDGQGSGADDGILTAAEAAQLDLYGTDLVVLSACDTGLGEVHDGDGIFGMRRAFQEAGVRSTVMSLWEVPDAETETLMRAFYTNWLTRRESKADALRNAQLALRDSLLKARHQADKDVPFFWGAFILVGEP